MTTKNIVVPEDDGEGLRVDDLVADLGRIGAAARRRAGEVRDEVRAIDTRRENARVGARVVERKLRDDIVDLAEEADQLSWILGHEPPEDADDEGSQPTPDEPPAPPDETPAVPPAPPQEPPATPETTPPAQPPVVVVQRPRWYHVRRWSGLQWLLAAAGLILGLILVSFWPDWAGRNIQDDTLQGVVDVLWVIAHPVAGFFLGGFVGFLIEERRRNTEE